MDGIDSPTLTPGRPAPQAKRATFGTRPHVKQWRTGSLFSHREERGYLAPKIDGRVAPNRCGTSKQDHPPSPRSRRLGAQVHRIRPHGVENLIGGQGVLVV